MSSRDCQEAARPAVFGSIGSTACPSAWHERNVMKQILVRVLTVVLALSIPSFALAANPKGGAKAHGSHARVQAHQPEKATPVAKKAPKAKPLAKKAPKTSRPKLSKKAAQK